MHACMHAYIHTYIHACIHTYIHTSIHTYIQLGQPTVRLTRWGKYRQVHAKLSVTFQCINKNMWSNAHMFSLKKWLSLSLSLALCPSSPAFIVTYTYLLSTSHTRDSPIKKKHMWSNQLHLNFHWTQAGPSHTESTPISCHCPCLLHGLPGLKKHISFRVWNHQAVTTFHAWIVKQWVDIACKFCRDPLCKSQLWNPRRDRGYWGADEAQQFPVLWRVWPVIICLKPCRHQVARATHKPSGRQQKSDPNEVYGKIAGDFRTCQAHWSSQVGMEHKQKNQQILDGCHRNQNVWPKKMSSQTNLAFSPWPSDVCSFQFLSSSS